MTRVKQTIIVEKNARIDTREEAVQIAKKYADRIYTSRETDSSFRFRQISPTKVDPDTYKTFHPKPGVAIVTAELKKGKKK